MKKKTLLFIGHTYHLKTKSSNFIQDILSKEYEITNFNFDPFTDDPSVYQKLGGQSFDVVVLWQIMPSIITLKRYVNFKKGIFFPMYDYYVAQGRMEMPLWEEYTNMQMICFSKSIYKDLKTAGFSAKYIQYFPKPVTVSDMGNERSLFFWQRMDQINIQTVETLFQNFELEHIHMHQAIDPGHHFMSPSAKWKEKVSYSTWYDKKEDMLKDIQKSSIYVAPRIYEGIGMSFLEAMALGRCVIAHDDATMNEYIENGKTGFLYDWRMPQALTINSVRQIQKNTLEYISKGYHSWQKDKKLILKWIDEKLNVNIDRLNVYLYRNKEGYGEYSLYIGGIRFFNHYKTPTRQMYSILSVPLLKIKTKFDKSKKLYYLFGFLPVLTMKKKEF